MDIKELKAKLHDEIDSLHNTAALELLHDAAVNYNASDKPDILDELSTDQKQRLDISLEQAAEGNTISNNDVKELISKWRKK